MKSPSAAVALLAALLLAGCGGGSEQPPPASGGPTGPMEPPAEPGVVEGGRVVVDLQDLQFVPEDVNVPAGATVTFTNSDQVSHTVTKDKGPGPDFDSGPIPPGGTFSQVFPDAGVVQIIDKNRPETELTVTVEEVEGTDDEEDGGGGSGDGSEAEDGSAEGEDGSGGSGGGGGQ